MKRFSLITALVLSLAVPMAVSAEGKPACCKAESNCAQGIQSMACCKAPVSANAASQLASSSIAGAVVLAKGLASIEPVQASNSSHTYLQANKPTASPSLFILKDSWLI